MTNRSKQKIEGKTCISPFLNSGRDFRYNDAKTPITLKTTNAFPKYSGYPKCLIPSLASSVCEVSAGIRPSNKAIMIVDVQKIIYSFFIFLEDFKSKLNILFWNFPFVL